jgi:hypothetical protein
MEHIIEGPLISFSEISLSVSPTALSPVALTSPHRIPSQQQQQLQQTTQLPTLGTSILSSTPLGQQQQQQAQISPTSAASSSLAVAATTTTSTSTTSSNRTNLTSTSTASPALTNSASTGSISVATHSPSPLQRRSSGIYLNSGISMDPFGHVTSGGGSGGGGIGKVANFQPQHRRSTSETTSSAISEQLSSSGSGHHSSQEGEQTRTQSLILIGLYDDPTSKTVLIDGVPMDWRSSSTQQHFDFFYEEVFQEMTKFGIVEDLVICENFFLEFRSSVFVKFNSTKAASVAFDNLSNSRYFGGRKVETRFCPVVDFIPRTCLDFDNSSCPRGNMCPLMHVRRPSNHVHLRLQEVQKALLR